MKKIIIVFGLIYGSQVFADCSCACIDGEVRSVCSSSMDIEPICPPRVCPIVNPSIAPIQAPRISPIGTSECVQKQVYNEFLGRYQWREVCY